jgi:hypothetical protein
MAAHGPGQIAQLLQSQATQIEKLKRQIEWFKRQIFGNKSERFVSALDAQQMHLGQLLGDLAPLGDQEEPVQIVPAHRRRRAASDFADEGASSTFFDEARVPVQVIEVPQPEVQGLSPEQHEVIGEKVSHRLAQCPRSFVVLKYVRPVIKRRDTQTLHCASAPAGIIEGTYLVDVLQRISVQPAQLVHELTPRWWKPHFAECPMRSDL